MKYTLQIALSKPVGDILLQVCEYAKKFGKDKAKNIDLLRFDFSGDIIEVTHPEKDCPLENAAIHAIETFTGIDLGWRNKWSEELNDGRDIQDFFERQYSEHILEENDVDPELHITFYVPLYEECVYKHIKYIIENLPKGHKFVANVIAITSDIAWACNMLDEYADNEEISFSMLQNITKIVELTKVQDGRFRTVLKHIFLFQNYNLDGWSQNFTLKKLIDVCSNLTLALVEHYDSICKGVWDDYAWNGNEIRHSRPIYAINVQDRTIDTYLAADHIIRDLFKGAAANDIINKESVDKEKVKDTFKNILAKEVELIKKYKGNQISGLLNQEDYDTGFEEVVTNQIHSIISQNIATANLNVSEQQYLYSLFSAIDEHTDFEGSEFDENVWQLEEMMLEQLDGDADLLETFEKLKKCSKELTATNNKIEQLEATISTLQKKLIEDYPANGVLTEEGFKIGNEVFKPYNCQDVPLEDDYEIPDGQVLPSSVDLRESFSDIKSQGAQGSCSAFSSVSVIEYFLSKIQNKRTDLSEAFVYYNAREIKDKTEVDEGASFKDIIEAIKDKGICVEELCPYNQNVYNKRPTDEAYADAEERKITEAKNVNLNIRDVKSALAKGFPVIISARAFDTYLLNANGVLRIPTKEELQDTENNHAMVICGYIDKEGFFIVRNSWGRNFGDNGYCYLPYEYFRTPKAINQAYVVTGINIPGFNPDALPTVDSLLDGKDVNAQYSIYQNILLEASHDLESNRNHLNDLRQEYLNLFNQIADYSNVELTLNELKEKSDRQRADLEEKLKEIAIAVEEKKLENKTLLDKLNFFKRKSELDKFDDDRKRIESELEGLDHYADDEKRKFRVRLAIMNGLKSINQDCVLESIRRKELSDYYNRQKSRIECQDEIDSDEVAYLKRIIPIDKILEQLRDSGINATISNLGNVISRVINGESSYQDSLEGLQQDVIDRINNMLDVRISDYLNDTIYDEFFQKISHSTVMAQIEGSVPIGYGDETKFFFCNVTDMPKRVTKECDDISLLPIKDDLRMCFLHMEKYDIEDFTIFNEVIEKNQEAIANARISIKNDEQIANYARLAAHVYGDRPDRILPIGCKIIESVEDAETGMKASLYDLGNNKAVCAFAGTQKLKDWLENIKQIIGLSPQYDKALEYAVMLQKKYPILDISFVGHSQGGGEAAYCALNQGAKAYTFNPAGLSRFTSWKGESEFTRYKDIQAYIFWNDILNKLQDLTPLIEEWIDIPLNLTADGCIHYISDYEPKELSLAYYHGMQGILDYFDIH